MRVLVIDDDPRVRAAMTAELTAAGCQPTATAPEHLGQPGAAPRSPSALVDLDQVDVTRVDVTKVDVALVDVALPTVTDGLALIEVLSVAMPVVAFSINGAARVAALSAGAVAYLEKDGDTDRLLDTLHVATRITDLRRSR